MKRDAGVKGRILLVEDEDLLRSSIKSFLEKRLYKVEAVGDGRDGLARAAADGYDLLVTDLNLQGVEGFDLAATAMKNNPGIEVVIITAHGSKESVIRALRQGVWDYVEKPFDLDLLLITIEKAFDKIRMERELVRLGRTDGLTGLFNQRHFYSVLSSELRRATRQKKTLSLLLTDVDNFKAYNDLHGHLEGDALLQRLAECLKRACRQDVDLAFRYGGDEFVIILPEADRDAAEAVASRIALYVKEEKLPLTLSIGITEFEGEQDLRSVIRQADEAMYLAKQRGGNRSVVFQGA